MSDRTMFSRPTPPHHKRSLQPYLRRNDALHPAPPPHHLATPAHQETHPLHPLQPRHLRHHVRPAQQILLLRAPLLAHVGILVCPRSVDRRACCKYADVLATAPKDLQLEGFQWEFFCRSVLDCKVEIYT